MKYDSDVILAGSVIYAGTDASWTNIALETPNINCQTDFFSQNSFSGAFQGKKQHFVDSWRITVGLQIHLNSSSTSDAKDLVLFLLYVLFIVWSEIQSREERLCCSFGHVISSMFFSLSSDFYASESHLGFNWCLFLNVFYFYFQHFLELRSLWSTSSPCALCSTNKINSWCTHL